MVSRADRLFYRKHMRKLYRRWERLDSLATYAEDKYKASFLPDGRFSMTDLDESIAARKARDIAAAKFWRTDDLMWSRLRRQANERAFGI